MCAWRQEQSQQSQSKPQPEREVIRETVPAQKSPGASDEKCLAKLFPPLPMRLAGA